jgi:hypothetical protein
VSASLVAEPITEANVEERLIGGPDAIGGVGDWYLANDRIEVIVDDPGRQHAKLNHGGTIVDAGLRGREGDDQFARLFTIVNLDQRVQLNYDAMRAELDPDGRFARLVVWSRRGMSAIGRGGRLARWLNPLVPESDAIEKVFAETVYEVRPGEPFVRITTTLRNEGDEDAPVFSYGDVWMRGGRSMRSFVGNTLEPGRSRGFHHLGFDKDAILQASEAMAPFSFVAMAGLPVWPPVAYAIAAPERVAQGLLNFGVTGKHVTLVNAIVEDPGWDAVGLVRLLRATRGRLAAGAAWSYERRLLVSGGRDVASSTDHVFRWLGVADGRSGIEGGVAPPGLGVVIHVETPDGFPVTQIATSTEGPEAGRYRAVLPAGEYRLVLRAEQRPPRRIEVTVREGGWAEVPVQRFDETGYLVLVPAFADGGPGRIIVSGLGETPDPVFRPELLDFRIDGAASVSGTETREIHFVGSGRDPRRVAIAPGRYRLTATRGLEFELAELEIEVPEVGAEVKVPPFALERMIGLSGVLSADLHVHAQASDDSGMDNEARLRSYVAEFVDVMVTSDHDHLGNFEPALDALAVRDRIRVIQGVEITSSTPSPAAPWTIGHHNAWPLPFRPHAHRRGAPPSQNRTVAELYAELRRDYGAEVVQLNHPLVGDQGVEDGAYLSHLGDAGEGFDASLPLDAEPNRRLLVPASDGRTRAIDFDAMEVMNGTSFAQYRRLREAWYALLRQGLRRTATGNSDTHGPDEIAGYPRNYVSAGRRFESASFDAAVRDGRLFTTTGPLIAGFRANGGLMGDTANAPGGKLEVEIDVKAAPWVPVDEVRLLVNGEVVRVFRELAEPPEVLRLSERVELRLRADGFLTVEAGVPLDTEPARWISRRGGVYASLVAPGFVPQALSNPIWVDVDGDGAIAAPGLPHAGLGEAGDRLVSIVLLILLLAVVWWRLHLRAARAGATI